MNNEEFKRLVEEYKNGLNQVEEVKDEFNKKYENLSKNEFVDALSKDYETVLEDATKNGVKVKAVKKGK